MQIQLEYNKRIEIYSDKLGKVLDFPEFYKLIADMLEYFSGTESWFERNKRDKIIFELEEIINRLECDGYDEEEYLCVKSKMRSILLQSKSTSTIY